MTGFTFSKRLYSVQGNLIFLIYALGVLLLVVTRPVQWESLGLLALVVLMLTFALVCSLGWRYALRRGSTRWLWGYFIFQFALVTFIFVLENVISGGGSTSGNVYVLLLLQSSVLSWRARLIICGWANLSMGFISLAFLPFLPVIITTGILFISNGAVLLLGNLIVSEERARQQLDEAHKKLAEYAQQIEELATTRERNRIAREIHDNLGHYLTIVNVQIEVAETVMQSEPERARLALARAQELTKEGLTAVRQSITTLRSEATTRDPLHAAITQLIEEHREAGLEVEYLISGIVRPVSDEKSLAIYRAVQEGLTNIRKHAHAKHTTISLSYGDKLHLCIQDDGLGSDQTQAGFGLLGMKERVQLLGGTMTIETTPGQGFRLTVEVAL
jgi:signal transduction histidine kinase